MQHTGKLLTLSKTQTKIIMAFPQLSRQKWVEMWVKRTREVIDYNMPDLFIPSCGIIKSWMRVTRHSRSCDYQGATETWWRQPHEDKATLPYWTTFSVLFWINYMVIIVIKIQSRFKRTGPPGKNIDRNQQILPLILISILTGTSRCQGARALSP